MTARLRELFAPHLDETVDAPPNLSVVVGADGDANAKTREQHLLLRGSAIAASSPSLGSILRALPSHLDAYATPAPGTSRLVTRAIVGPDDAVLVDVRFAESVRRAEARLARHGYLLSRSPYADVDRSTGELVLTVPRVGFEPAAAAALDAEFPPMARELRPDGRRVPIRALVTLDVLGESEHVHPSRAVASLVPLAIDRHGGYEAGDVELLARWHSAGRIRTREWLAAKDLVAEVTLPS